MFYLAGIGLNHIEQIKKNLIIQELLSKCKYCYVDVYTNYIDETTLTIFESLNVHKADRSFVESLEILNKANKEDVCLFVSGDPLYATTHSSLLIECKKRNIDFNVIHNVSVSQVAISLSGLNSYKFGRTVTLTKVNFQKSDKSEPLKDSNYSYIINNYKNNFHTLILIDPELSTTEPFEIFKNYKRIYKQLGNQLLVMSRLGNDDQKIVYTDYKDYEILIKNNLIKKPFCMILPAKNLHFSEVEFLETFYK
ncbi:MAG: diphthine synthase [Candidatus Micrarchaeota archaeon]|nr:diphthine synthase [Candidatus Micrarchaeota archaeon]